MSGVVIIVVVVVEVAVVQEKKGIGEKSNHSVLNRLCGSHLVDTIVKLFPIVVLEGIWLARAFVGAGSCQNSAATDSALALPCDGALLEQIHRALIRSGVRVLLPVLACVHHADLQEWNTSDSCCPA